jgi:SAM-dependent methyltransferase
MTKEQLDEGLAYAEDNFLNDHAPHLRVDKELIRQRFDLTNKKILDFGCGMGGMSLWYATNWDCEVHGLDIDNHHVNIANQMKEKHGISNVRFEVRNVLERPLEEKYDYVFLNDVAEHIPLNILKEIMSQLGNALNDGGQIFVTYPPWKSPYASHVTHAVKIPWCQYLPDSLLLKLIEKNNMVLVGDEESDLVEAYKGLNHLTHEKLMKVINGSGLKPVYRKSHCLLNKVKPLKEVNFNFFPLDFLITKEFLLLQKN